MAPLRVSSTVEIGSRGSGSKRPLGKPRTPQQERSRFTRGTLVEATSQLVEQRGATSTTTTMIAERAGVSVGTLYQYFADREDLLRAAAIERQSRHRASFERCVSEQVGSRLETLVRVCVRSALELNRDHPRLETELTISVDERGLVLNRAHDRIAVRIVCSRLREHNDELATDAHPIAALIVVCVLRYVTMCWNRDRLQLGGDDDAFEAALTRMVLRYLCGRATLDAPVVSRRPFRTDRLQDDEKPSGPNLPTKAPRQRRSIRTVDSLITAAREALASDGAAAASVRSIARSAGVGLGTLYQYFPAKEALNRAVVEAQMRSFFDRYEADLSRFGPLGLGELLNDCLRGVLEEYRRAPGLMSALVRTGPNLMGLGPNRIQDHRTVRALKPHLVAYGDRLAVKDTGLAALIAAGTVRYACLVWARDRSASSTRADDDLFRTELVTALLHFLLHDNDPELTRWARRSSRT